MVKYSDKLRVPWGWLVNLDAEAANEDKVVDIDRIPSKGSSCWHIWQSWLEPYQLVVEGLVDILVDTVTEGTGDKSVKTNCEVPKEDMAEQETSTLADTVTVNDVAVFDEVTLFDVLVVEKCCLVVSAG